MEIKIGEPCAEPTPQQVEETTQALRLLLKEPEAMRALAQALPEGRFVMSAPKAHLPEVIKRLGESLANLDHWKELSAKDRQAYHDELDNALSIIKALINMHCGIDAQRPRQHSDRDRLIVSLKTPQRTFGQVAKLYAAQTGETITAKLVERICKRYKAETTKRHRRLDFNIANLMQLIDVFPKIGYKVDGSN